MNRAKGYGGVFPKGRPRRDITLYFHPFRFYVLYHIARVFSFEMSPTQYLLHPAGCSNLCAHRTSHLDWWTKNRDCSALFNQWNTVAEMAIVCQPCYFPHHVYDANWHFPYTPAQLNGKRIYYKEQLLKTLVTEDDVVRLEQFRELLCFDARRFDPNTIIHVLIRLTTWYARNAVGGRLGGCMTLLAMAEMIRRAMENALGRSFKEEDECGRDWMQGARRLLYGTERVLDAPETALRTFLADAGIDYGTKVRCYLEGNTELGALKTAIGDLGGIELINLAGQISAGRRKGVSFRESLNNDVQAQVFSFIILDSDNEECVRAVKSAARDDVICGTITLSEPDFEFANFTTSELCEILVRWAHESGVSTPPKEEMIMKAANVSSGKQFFEVLGSEYRELARFRKCEAWGEAAMRYAMQETRKGAEERPIIRAARLVIRAKDMKYTISREKFKLDPVTGQLVERKIEAPG